MHPIAQPTNCVTVARSHKVNDRDHSAVADGSAGPQSHEHLSRFFTKSGPVYADPKKTKKDGGGKGNWGRSGDEMQDSGYTFTNARRRSNSSTQGLADFRTKFEAVDSEPVFEERLHGVIGDGASVENPGGDKAASARSNNTAAAAGGWPSESGKVVGKA